MADGDFPIDINYAKIAEWLVRPDSKAASGRSSERGRLLDFLVSHLHHHHHTQKKHR
jgi:hypothetical protein